MTEMQTPSDVVAQRIKEIRERRRWSRRGLAEECAKVGAARLTENVLENIEYGRRDKEGRRRRDITVDELLIFAYVLDVAPVHLLVPTGTTSYRYVPQEQPAADGDDWPLPESDAVRRWVRGELPMPGTDPRMYFSEVPEDEFVVKVIEGIKKDHRLRTERE